MRNLLIKLAAGAVGGAAATALINAAMPHSRKLPARFRPIAPRQDPGDFMVKQAEKLVGALSPKMHSRAVHSLPWAYGLSWPLGLAALSGVLAAALAGQDDRRRRAARRHRLGGRLRRLAAGAPA